MMGHFKADGEEGTRAVDCGRDPIGSLTEMFVRMVQGGRIKGGQCPALRPVFHKPHGVARGIFRIRPNLPEQVRVGLFRGTEYPAWIRFSSDTAPTANDFKSTVGVAIKLFDTPTPKIFGRPEDTTFDFILQNFDVFFVDTAADMCEFTKAGVIDRDYEKYLDAHPVTRKLLDDMAQPVASTLGISYRSCIPFALGASEAVKYRLTPATPLPPLADPPPDPTYLAADLRDRLKANDAVFRFEVQFSTDPVAMPIDRATVRWDEKASPPIHVADLIIHRQNITARGQAEYGENLSWNIWRVTDEHKPLGSIADARRVVYAASAEQRRDANGVPTGEPSSPRPVDDPGPCKDTTIVRASIHPAIGIARIGNSRAEHFIGPEVVTPANEQPDHHRDPTGAIKRQAARFRLYGYNAAGEVVGELNSDNADIRWAVHVANKKAQWYRFIAALDIPEASAMAAKQRNAAESNRAALAIDPGPRSISGKSVAGGPQHRFDTGTFKGTAVDLGELRTDARGRLLFLGGTGISASPSNAPIFDRKDPDTFANADDWYDDTSDGPVSATVSINGAAIPVEPAWVVVAPPNYAPNIIGWRTMLDLLDDMHVRAGWTRAPARPSFVNDILPILRRLSNLQWVNKGFATLYGKGCAMDFDSDELIGKFASEPDPNTYADPHSELRQIIANHFRPPKPRVAEPVVWPHVWPWIYGDAYGSFDANGTGNLLTCTELQSHMIGKWVAGEFDNDWPHRGVPVTDFTKVPLAAQPEMLDRAALHFCLADAFHPGCEMTWPMRHTTMYSRPFRIRHRPAAEPAPDSGQQLTQKNVFATDGPLHRQGPGDITRWMAVPWQADTAFCRSGYEEEYDPYLPAFWPARVPNQVLTEEEYQTVIDTTLSREVRIVAFNHRAKWTRAVDRGDAAAIMLNMIREFGALGIVEAKPGPANDPDFPETMFVETFGASHLKKLAMDANRALRTPSHRLSRIEQAGWSSEEQYREFRRIRLRYE